MTPSELEALASMLAAKFSRPIEECRAAVRQTLITVARGVAVPEVRISEYSATFARVRRSV